MLEKRLQELIKEAKEIKNMSIENNSASYFNDVFYDLSNFIISKLNSLLFNDINIKIIANQFDEILPYVVSSNINILIQDTKKLVEQPGFKEKFIKGLKKYPYKDKIDKLLYFIWAGLNNNPNQFNTFIDSEILNTLSIMDLNGIVYLNILKKLNENKEFLIELCPTMGKREFYKHCGFKYKPENMDGMYLWIKKNNNCVENSYITT